MGKLIIVTAPSGAGKTTIVKHLLKVFDVLAFSVSATTREKRINETEGQDYYFITNADFKRYVKKKAFIEWQEVYENQFYGTLLSEVERLWSAGRHVIFDIDVKGALNLKKTFPGNSLSIFVRPPSKEALFNRLKQRKSETEESLLKRIEKATIELSYEDKFDVVLENNDLENTLKNAEEIVSRWLFTEKLEKRIYH